MQSKTSNVDEYLNELSGDRREQIAQVRKVILDNLPDGYEENMNWGMISYEIPLSTYQNTYNDQPLLLAGLTSQKNHMAVYLNSIYADPQMLKWFEDKYAKSGKKLDMGKSCVRFKDISQLPLKLIGQAIARVSVEDYIMTYENTRGAR